MSLNIVTVSINGSAKEQLATVGVVGVGILCSKKPQLCYALLLISYHYYAPQNGSLCSISKQLCSHY